MASLRFLSLGDLASRDLHLNIFLLKALGVWGQCVLGQARTHPSYHLGPSPCHSLGFFLLNKGFLAGISAPHLFSRGRQSPSTCPPQQATMGGQDLKPPDSVWLCGSSLEELFRGGLLVSVWVWDVANPPCFPWPSCNSFSF